MRISPDSFFGHFHQLIHALLSPWLTIFDRIQEWHIFRIIYICLSDSIWDWNSFTIHGLSLRLDCCSRLPLVIEFHVYILWFFFWGLLLCWLWSHCLLRGLLSWHLLADNRSSAIFHRILLSFSLHVFVERLMDFINLLLSNYYLSHFLLIESLFDLHAHTKFNRLPINCLLEYFCDCAFALEIIDRYFPFENIFFAENHFCFLDCNYSFVVFKVFEYLSWHVELSGNTILVSSMFCINIRSTLFNSFIVFDFNFHTFARHFG